MKAVTLTLIGLTLLLAFGGIKVALDNSTLTTWVGAIAPAALLLYMTIRVARDTTNT